MKRTALATLVAVCLGLSVASAALDPVTRRDAARLQAKIDRISKNGSGPRNGNARTPISEIELNSYVTFELGENIPAGVTEPWISLTGPGRLSGRAVVDLGAIGRSRKSGGLLDPFSYLSGRLPLVVNGLLKTSNGVGSFAVESVSVSGMPVPVWMLQEIVTYYSKSSQKPQGVSVNEPFALPAGIREIQVDRGQAIVVQ
jgi:hypothetical protein